MKKYGSISYNMCYLLLYIYVESCKGIVVLGR